jgi:raffinose/stachyose/melibiose transport system substrate-binding protein
VIFVAVVLAVLPLMAVFANGAKESGPITLNWPSIWVGKDSKAPAVAALVDEFNTAHQGKIQVAVEPNPDYDGYRNKINTQIAAGQVPDVFVFNPDPTTFQYYQGNALMNFTKDLQGSWGNEFVPGTVKQATRDGATKSIPYEIGVTPIWYNMALFQKAGISAPPKTMDEFWADATKLKAAGIVPTTQMTGGSNAWTSMLWYSHILASIAGPNVWDKPLFQGNDYVEAAKILQRMYQNGNTTKDAVGADAGVAGGHFLAGQTAMFINGPWYIARVKKDAPDVYKNIKLAPLPKVAGGNFGGTIAFPLSNLAAGNTDNPAKREAVIAFLKWMTQPDNVAKISESSGSLFAIKFKIDPAKVDPLQAQFIDQLNNATFAIPHIQYQLPSKVTAQLGQGFGAMALGTMTPQQFVEFMHKQLQEAQ